MGDQREEKRYTTGEHALTAGQAMAVLEACRKLERKALLSTTVATGMRRGDVVQIEVANVEWVDGVAEITFWEEKKERWWTSWVPRDLAQPLRMHMESLPSASRFVWPSDRSQSGHISSRSAWNWFNEALDRAGIPERPFHALRATCMKLARGRGWTIEQTMKQTGDSWRTVQEHYLTPGSEEMREAAQDPWFAQEDKET